MKLWLISQSENKDWDTYDSAVVAAEIEEQARNMHPSDGSQVDWDEKWGSWASSPEHVTVKYLGEAAPGIEAGVICASFNAG